MKIVETEIPDVRILQPTRHGDARGWFEECWSAQRMREAGLDIDFIQDNHAFSATPATLRGLHFQSPPHPQGKLVRVARGRILDVAVDIRRGSPHYGRWVGVELSAENGRQLWVPPGFAHGYVTRDPDTHVLYKVNGQYAPDCEGAIRHDDPVLAIDWGLAGKTAIVSAKDAAAPAFDDLDTPFDFEVAT